MQNRLKQHIFVLAKIDVPPPPPHPPPPPPTHTHPTPTHPPAARAPAGINLRCHPPPITSHRCYCSCAPRPRVRPRAIGVPRNALIAQSLPVPPDGPPACCPHCPSCPCCERSIGCLVRDGWEAQKAEGPEGGQRQLQQGWQRIRVSKCSQQGIRRNNLQCTRKGGESAETQQPGPRNAPHRARLRCRSRTRAKWWPWRHLAGSGQHVLCGSVQPMTRSSCSNRQPVQLSVNTVLPHSCVLVLVQLLHGMGCPSASILRSPLFLASVSICWHPAVTEIPLPSERPTITCEQPLL